MSTIAIDIDDTLYSFTQVARDMFLELAEEWNDPTIRNGGYNPWTEWRSLMDSAGPKAGEEVIRRVHDPKVIMSRTPFPDAAWVCYALVKAGHTIQYISNRCPDTWGATKDWLNLKGFPDGELTCNLNDKLPQVAHCQYLIDDRPKTLVQFIHDYGWIRSMREGHSDDTDSRMEEWEDLDNAAMDKYFRESWASYKQEFGRVAFALASPVNQNLTDVPGVYLSPTWRGIGHYLKKKGVL